MSNYSWFAFPNAGRPAMSILKIAFAQVHCALGNKQHNLRQMHSKLDEAAQAGARLVIFPECALTGYCFESKEEALPYAEPLPGPSSEKIAAQSKELGLHTIFGLLERDEGKTGYFNACALVGPAGLVATYRKIHLPFLGPVRFALPGDLPFALPHI